jgi:hypothetical protein
MNKRIRLVLLLFTLCVFVLSMGCQKQDSAWKGTISEENGMTIVKNPKEPIYGADIFSLKEELAITDDAGGEECIFAQIRGIDVDESGKIYILDFNESHVYIFNSNGTYIKTFGRKGQGPGELDMPMTIKIIDRNKVAVGNFNKGMIFYDLEGNFIHEIHTEKSGARGVEIDNDYNLYGVLIVPEEEDPRFEFIKFDPEMNRLCSFGSSPLPTARKEGFNPFGGALRYAIRRDNFVISGDPQTYEINVYDPTGNLIRKISKEYDPVEITQEEKDRVMERMSPDIKVSIPKYHNPYNWFIVDDEGRLYVTTHEQVEEGEGFYYDVFDPEGKCLVKIPLKSRPQIIKKNKLYTVESDEEGFLTVKRYRIDWKI